MEHSEQLNELAAALCKAQAEIKPAAKDTANPFFKTKYADLSSVWDACKDALTKHDLSVSQFCLPSEPHTLNLTTMLLHSSGQFLSGTMSIPLPKNDPQGFGSALTYGRRYGLAAIVGVCPDDDDGEGARNATQEPMRAEVQSQTGDKWMGEERAPCCGATKGFPHKPSCQGVS